MYEQKTALRQTKLTPEKLLKMIKGEEAGMSNEEAASLLLFLRKLARIVVNKYLEQGK
ncbi:MAG TPA: hypothetical protein PKW69_12150 [Niabella sp.]|nr:hypothetical protein [Niabella sp.]